MSDNHDYPWLNGTEELFPKNPPGQLNACLAYRHGQGFHAYALGYQRSAEMLFETLQERRYLDPQYFALAYLWRQALELTLKHLHESLGQLELMAEFREPTEKASDAAAKAPLPTHDLRKLWAIIEPRMQRFMAGAPEHGWIARVIEQFHRVDPRSDEFRYPTKAGNKTKTLASLEPVVSLTALDRTMRALLNTLGAAVDEIDRLLGLHVDAMELEEQTEG